jgi:beta-phosphoglucomutase-like phosphatase (HAD superfamily)
VTKLAANVLITDLDNTLWDWFEVWHKSFSALIGELVRLSRVTQSVLEQEIRQVHQRARTSEYSNLVDELPSLKAAAGRIKPSTAFEPAIRTFRSTRRHTIHLYPGVFSTLAAIRETGVPVVGYTESNEYWTEWRIHQTKLVDRN